MWSRGTSVSFDFNLLENDYVIGEKKIAGNAQYIGVKAFLHHSSFLFDFEKTKMDLLLIPKKMPNYRNNRTHDDFIQKLNAIFKKKGELFSRLYKVLEKHFEIKVLSKKEIFSKKFPSHKFKTIILK